MHSQTAVRIVWRAASTCATSMHVRHSIGSTLLEFRRLLTRHASAHCTWRSVNAVIHTSVLLLVDLGNNLLHLRQLSPHRASFRRVRSPLQIVPQVVCRLRKFLVVCQDNCDALLQWRHRMQRVYSKALPSALLGDIELAEVIIGNAV